jgi:hypothetical protein
MLMRPSPLAEDVMLGAAGARDAAALDVAAASVPARGVSRTRASSPPERDNAATANV